MNFSIINFHLSKQVMKKTTLICALLTLSGCASGPREVSASLPLVSGSMEKPSQKMVPARYWSILSDETQSRLTHQQYQISLGEPYFSALGLTCRELQFKEKLQAIKKRVTCEHKFIDENNQATNGWFLEKEIIESSHSVEM